MGMMRLAPIVLLVFSNVFMTYAWYGQGYLYIQRQQVSKNL
jgi:uncharacterized protein (DUF486 family)